jgi:predicted Zn-dependent protease
MMRSKFLNSTLTALVFFIMAGLTNTCVHGSKPESLPVREKPAETVATPPMELIKEPLAPAVQSLLNQTEAALQQQQYQQAEAHAERAYRMEGRDYRVLFTRARISLSLGAPDDAEQWAQRALGSLPAKYQQHRQLTWEFIARTRAVRGDEAGHDEALKQALSVR